VDGANEETRSKMDRAVRDCLVSGYEPLIAGLYLPDPDDRHVLAAAVFARTDFIVTFNLRDFPAEVLSSHGIEARHPDEFVLGLLDVATAEVCAVAHTHRRSLTSPPKSVDEYLDTLQRYLPKSAAILAEFGDRL